MLFFSAKDEVINNSDIVLHSEPQFGEGDIHEANECANINIIGILASIKAKYMVWWGCVMRGCDLFF